MRRSEMLLNSVTATVAKSKAKASGWPWKLPPEITSPVSGNTTGLSTTDPSSTPSTPSAKPSTSRAAPCTWGAQRRL